MSTNVAERPEMSFLFKKQSLKARRKFWLDFSLEKHGTGVAGDCEWQNNQRVRRLKNAWSFGKIPVGKPEFHAHLRCVVKYISRGLVSHLLDIKAIESKAAWNQKGLVFVITMFVERPMTGGKWNKIDFSPDWLDNPAEVIRADGADLRLLWTSGDRKIRLVDMATAKVMGARDIPGDYFGTREIFLGRDGVFFCFKNRGYNLCREFYVERPAYDPPPAL